MSQHDPHEHGSFIKTPKQLIAVVVLAFVVPVLGIALIASLAFRALEPQSAAQSDEVVAKRMKPVGEVVIAEGPIPPEAIASKGAPAAPAPAAAGTAPTGDAQVAAAAPAGSAAGAGAKGKPVYDQVCAVCHTAGVAGAPKLGDNAAWAPRLKQGLDVVHANALKGKGAMPPKGGNPSLSDADVKAAVDFMVGQSK